MIFQNSLETVGNTPVVRIPIPEMPGLDVFAKLEFNNPTGSIKDRAADYILRECLASGEINKNTMIIESSSGNFGVALAAYCQLHGLKFICVVDPNIVAFNEYLLRCFNARIIKVDQQDDFGGYLLTRIDKVREIVRQHTNIFWVNQYNNPLNARAYYQTIGAEICAQFDRLDYIFIGVSSGGTITGLSHRMKEHFPGAKIIAVDSKGSVIFNDVPRKRYIPGIGSSLRPSILEEAIIDDHVLVDEYDAVKMCHTILQRYRMLVGGSSGSVLAGIREYFQKTGLDWNTRVLAIFPDKGEKYIGTIYNENWYTKIWCGEKETYEIA